MRRHSSFFKVFHAAAAIGLWKLRGRRASKGLSKSPFQVWDIAIVLWLFQSVFLFVMPWCVHSSTINVLELTGRHVRVPPEKGHADVTFWYATCVVLFLLQPCTVVVLTSFSESSYCVVGVILLLVRDILIISRLATTNSLLVSSPPCTTTFGSSYYPGWVGMRLWKRSWI